MHVMTREEAAMHGLRLGFGPPAKRHAGPEPAILIPTRWLIAGIPSRAKAAEHAIYLRITFGRWAARRFRQMARMSGLWPVAWRRADGTRVMVPQ